MRSLNIAIWHPNENFGGKCFNWVINKISWSMYRSVLALMDDPINANLYNLTTCEIMSAYKLTHGTLIY